MKGAPNRFDRIGGRVRIRNGGTFLVKKKKKGVTGWMASTVRRIGAVEVCDTPLSEEDRRNKIENLNFRHTVVKTNRTDKKICSDILNEDLQGGNRLVEKTKVTETVRASLRILDRKKGEGASTAEPEEGG